MQTASSHGRRQRPGPELLRFKIELADIKPVIWRRFVVPESITLPKLHQVIQAVMGWCDCHLHEFEFADQRYGVPDPDHNSGANPRSEQRVRLSTALGSAKSFRYVYDFGDDWEHRVKIEKRFPHHPEFAKTAFCLAGENACPPEDVGSTTGYENFVAAMSDERHPEHYAMMKWHGEPFDESYLNAAQINRFLETIRL